jgi:hypothetical protein
VKFQQYSADAPSVLVVLRLVYTRPVKWATGTDFDASRKDFNQITIRIPLNNRADGADYKRFTQWLTYNAYDGKAKSCNTEQMAEVWAELSRGVV